MPYVTRGDDISVLELSLRTQNCLRRTGIHTIGAMLDYPEGDLIEVYNIGQKECAEIQIVIQSLLEGDGKYHLVEGRKSKVTEQEQAKESVILLDENYAVVGDINIQNLQISVRAKNALTIAGYQFVSELLEMGYDDLIAIKNMGKKSAQEVLDYLKQISVSNIIPSNRTEVRQKDSLVVDMQQAYGESEASWLREILTAKEQYPDITGETLLYRLYDQKFVRALVKAKILKILEENGSKISRSSLDQKLPTHLLNTTIVEEILIELESRREIMVGETMIFRVYPSIVDYVADIPKERTREIMTQLLKGRTLQEVGVQFGVERERVRQIRNKALLNRPYLREDQYFKLYDQYDFSLEDFKLAFQELDETYYYLEMISKTTRSKRKTLSELITDTSISPALRKRAERAIYKQYISIDGVRIKKSRPELVKHFVKTYCKNRTQFSDFENQYQIWLDTLDLTDCLNYRIESKTYENRLNQCDYVLWNQGRCFRYYNMVEYDFEELLSTLNMEQYENTEISTLKFVRDYPELMKQYDIRDEYELHNLLKKIWPPENHHVNFKKMPTIEIGVADHTAQVLSTLLQYAPIKADDLAERYEEEYGVKAATVRGSYFAELDRYFYQGVYSVDYAALPEIQFQHMKQVLTQDFYTIQEAKQLYQREFPNSDETLLNSYTLKTLGYHVYPGYAGYIVKNTYSSATAYFNSILTKDDIVDIREYNPALRGIATYDSEHRRLRQNYEIVEFAPLQFINIRRLNEVGIQKEDLEDYCKSVTAFYEKGSYFTVKSMAQDGFTHKLDVYGFEEWFCSSLLFEDRQRFSAQRIGGTRLFLRGRSNGNLGGMLTWLLEQYQKIDFYDLMELLNDRYGIHCSRDRILQIISSTDLYYDAIMEAVYIDYDTYFEEV